MSPIMNCKQTFLLFLSISNYSAADTNDMSKHSIFPYGILLLLQQVEKNLYTSRYYGETETFEAAPTSENYSAPNCKGNAEKFGE